MKWLAAIGVGAALVLLGGAVIWSRIGIGKPRKFVLEELRGFLSEEVGS